MTFTKTLFEFTVPLVPGADATAPMDVGAGVGLSVPIVNAWPVHVVVVVLVMPDSVALLGSVKVQVAVVLMSCPPGWAVAVRQNGKPALIVTLWDDGAATMLVTPFSDTVTLVEPLTIPLVA